ncbi:penicillin-binding protein activator LpoB [Halorhodospira abdelmalekii]|uniref:penicillin-binding protein activator LpoB n=1 Tax=Halorhodospira abdelmalekii TaxID=421629 RepID=UPI0019048DCC|nr:penicillin-binding protein activator LpoB [Halorhodospira abdelmalekii]MBK1734111.1 penicillin-binding protein activator LpoB [Halorhodospira abdelmalekii]
MSRSQSNNRRADLSSPPLTAAPRLWSQVAAIVLIAALLAACGHSVKRIDRDAEHDLSGRWNDLDSRLVAEEMVADALDRAWLRDFQRQHGERPTVIVGSVRNLSHEHINTRTFVNDIQRELINSGRVDFVADARQREQIREERRDQDLHASAESRKAMGEELGADFMLLGSINSIIDQEGRRQVRYYQVDMELISLADNRKVWIGNKEIRKLIRSASVRP